MHRVVILERVVQVHDAQRAADLPHHLELVAELGVVVLHGRPARRRLSPRRLADRLGREEFPVGLAFHLADDAVGPGSDGFLVVERFDLVELVQIAPEAKVGAELVLCELVERRGLATARWGLRFGRGSALGRGLGRRLAVLSAIVLTRSTLKFVVE